MPIDAIIRVSFQSSVPANQAVNQALVGHRQHRTASGPFAKVNTALYQCMDADDADVGRSLAALGEAYAAHVRSIDFLSVSLLRKPGRKKAKRSDPRSQLPAHGGGSRR